MLDGIIKKKDFVRKTIEIDMIIELSNIFVIVFIIKM